MLLTPLRFIADVVAAASRHYYVITMLPCHAATPSHSVTTSRVDTPPRFRFSLDYATDYFADYADADAMPRYASHEHVNTPPRPLMLPCHGTCHYLPPPRLACQVPYQPLLMR